jgi:RND family efflux transporter MFP subunit
MKTALMKPLHKRRSLCCTLIVLCFLAAVLWGCQDSGKLGTVEIKRPAVTGVKTILVVLSTVDDVYETTGTVKAEHASVVASRIMGMVTAVYVKEGDRVKAGQLLMTIDHQELTQKVRGASMALETAKQNKALAETTWRRYRNLYDEKALSQQEMDQVETQKKVAESEYERAAAALAEAGTYQDFARIKAPMAGVVTSRKIDAGSMAVPGQPLLTIESASSFYVEIFVDETLTGRLKKSMPVEVAIDAEGRKFRGSIRDVISNVDQHSRTYLVKIALPAEGLKSGLYARIRIPVGKKNLILVPGNAVVQKGQLTGVYSVAPGGLVTYRLVKTGRSYPDGSIEILSGLVANEQIISEGVQKAVDGGMIQQNQVQ